MYENAVETGSKGPESWWRRLARRSIIIPILALVFTGAGAWVFMSLTSTGDKKESTLDSIIKASDTAYQSGDYQKSLQQLQEATDDAKSKEEKIVLYSNLAAAAASSGDMTQAIKYLEEKHQIAPETEDQDSYLLGSYYERIEDNSKAIEQYKKAVEYFKAHDNQTNRAKVESLKVRIESLGG